MASINAERPAAWRGAIVKARTRSARSQAAWSFTHVEQATCRLPISELLRMEQSKVRGGKMVSYNHRVRRPAVRTHEEGRDLCLPILVSSWRLFRQSRREEGGAGCARYSNRCEWAKEASGSRRVSGCRDDPSAARPRPHRPRRRSAPARIL